MNRRTTLLLTLAVASATGLSAFAGVKKIETKKQTKCPVMRSQPIEKSLYVDVKGKRVYVCCTGCVSQLKADPDFYLKRLADAGVTLEDAPKPKAQKKQAHAQRGE